MLHVKNIIKYEVQVGEIKLLITWLMNLHDWLNENHEKINSCPPPNMILLLVHVAYPNYLGLLFVNVGIAQKITKKSWCKFTEQRPNTETKELNVISKRNIP